MKGPRSPSETDEALKALSNGKSTDPNDLPAEIPRLGLNRETPEILYRMESESIVWGPTASDHDCQKGDDIEPRNDEVERRHGAQTTVVYDARSIHRT